MQTCVLCDITFLHVLYSMRIQSCPKFAAVYQKIATFCPPTFLTHNAAGARIILACDFTRATYAFMFIYLNLESNIHGQKWVSYFTGV